MYSFLKLLSFNSIFLFLSEFLFLTYWFSSLSSLFLTVFLIQQTCYFLGPKTWVLQIEVGLPMSRYFSSDSSEKLTWENQGVQQSYPSHKEGSIKDSGAAVRQGAAQLQPDPHPRGEPAAFTPPSGAPQHLDYSLSLRKGRLILVT